VKIHRFIPLAIAVAMAVACDDGDAHFTTKFASNFARAQRSASILGVYKDGRMAADAWGAYAPFVARAFGSAPCEIGYEALASANSPLASAIDEYARAEGPSDDLLAQIAGAAKGDLIVVLTVAGHVPQSGASDAGGAAMAPSFQGGGSRGGGMGMRGGGMGAGGGRGSSMSEPRVVKDSSVLDLAATVYSVAEKESVAVVSLQFSGSSTNDALTQFGTKLSLSLPQMRCAGWNWDVSIDPEKIRRAASE
jgi:hypothetical protein